MLKNIWKLVLPYLYLQHEITVNNKLFNNPLINNRWTQTISTLR